MMLIQYVLSNTPEVKELSSNIEEDEQREYDEKEIKYFYDRMGVKYPDFDYNDFFVLNDKRSNTTLLAKP